MEWLSRYVAAAKRISPLTPDGFHITIGLWIVGAVIGRRCVLRLPWGEVSPTLWVVLVAPSTTFRKSTALSIGRDLLRRVKPGVFCAQSFTVEALWDELQANPHRALIFDEYSGLLAASGRDYQAGLREMLMELADEPPIKRRHTKGSGDVTITRPSLALLSASTPSLLKRYVGDERMWADGFWPRHVLAVAPDDPLPWAEAQHADEEMSALAEHLVGLDARLGGGDPLTASMSREAYEMWAAFNKDLSYDAQRDPTLSDGRRAALGRTPMHALRAALALAALDWRDDSRVPVVEVGHMREATRLAAGWAEAAHRAIEAAHRTLADETAQRIMKLLAFVGGELTRRDVQQKIRVKPETLDEAINLLASSGAVAVKLEQGRGGTTTRIRRLEPAQ